MMDFEIVRTQIVNACKDLEITNKEQIRVFIHFFRFFYGEYKRRFGHEHKRLRTDSIEDVILNLQGAIDEWGYKKYSDDFEMLRDLANKYFDTRFTIRVDYSISHFASPAILENREFELM